MKFKQISLAFSLVILSILFLGSATYANDSTAIDTTIAYKKVDLVIECEWGDPETLENVNVLVIYRNSILRTIVVNTNDAKLEYSPAEGIVYKIYSRLQRPRRLLKTFPPLTFEITT